MGILQIFRKSELLNSKKIEVEIYVWNLRSVNSMLIQEFREIILEKKDLEILSYFHTERLANSVCNIVFKNFFDACKEYLPLIPSNNLRIRVVFSDTQSRIGIFHDSVSTEDYAFFSFFTYYAIAQAYKAHSLGDGSLIRAASQNKRQIEAKAGATERLIKFLFPDSRHLQYKHDFRTIIQHEFMHYLDVRQFKSATEIIKRTYRAVYPKTRDNMRPASLTRQPTPETLVYSVYRLRMEGLATFGESRKFIVDYNLQWVREFKSWISHYTCGPIIPDGAVNGKEMYYDCGGYICYFISLFILARKVPNGLNDLRVFFDEANKDFVFFGEGFGSIFRIAAERGLEVIYFQKPSKKIIDEAIKEITSLSHIGFVKMYEEACNALQVPREQILITLADYKAAKRKCYDYWIANIRREGFPTEGIED